jgi:hypothetical protein
MGLLEDFGAVIPADKQEAFKLAVAALDGAVKIDSRETVDKLAIDNPFIKSAIDSAISKAVESHDVKFKAEKLPGLIADELKKSAPKPKDPELAAALERVEALEKAKTQAERETFRAIQLSKVLPKLTELGIDAEIADRLIGNDDAETDKIIDKFYKSVTKAREEYATKILHDKFGNQGMPTKGVIAKPEDLETQYKEAESKNDGMAMLRIKAQIQAARNK